MGDENPIRTLGDYSKPSHEGYKNTIDLPVENNVVPLRSDTIRLVQNGCSFHGLRFEDPNQHLKDFLKLVDLVDLDALNFDSKSKFFMTMSFPSKDEPLTNRPVNDPRDFTKPIKAITLPQDVPSTSDCRLIELETQVQRLMEAHPALIQPTQVNKITTLCEICSGPHDTSIDSDTEEDDISSTNAHENELGNMVRRGKEVKEQGKEEDEMEIDVEIKEVIKDEESKIETDEEASPGMGRKVKLHLEREMEFNQWRSKNFKGKHPTLITTKGGMEDEGEVTYSAFGRHLEEIHVTWAHLEKKQTRLRTYTHIFKNFYSEAGDGVTDYT
ncbi:hypothetical protein Tco_1560859 [Tanacetum coccineum]